MTSTILLTAFALGFGASRLRLPPLVGYLAAGYVLHALGEESTSTIEAIAEAGVLILLFGIGLKMPLRSLRRREVWGATTLHMALTSLLGAGVVLGGWWLAGTASSVVGALVIGFALSFSSTIFAVKALEERNESGGFVGRTSLAILIVQDVAAVLFLALAVTDRPSPWALVVGVGLVAARPVYVWILDRIGHGELLVLLGLAMALGLGADLFHRVGLKPDVGAFVVGLTVASHPRASELADRLLGLKDLLLIGFFLSIGLGGLPDGAGLAIAAGLAALLPVKTVLMMVLLSRWRLRARTTWHTAVTLATFSEFGLIVATAAVARGWIGTEWPPILALAVAVSFVLAAPLGHWRYAAYRALAPSLGRLERRPVMAEDAVIDPGGSRILVLGMGRVGVGAYDELVLRRGDVVIGVDRDDRVVAANAAEGRRAVRGDALDRDFWEQLSAYHQFELVLLAMNDHGANVEAARRVREALTDVTIAATATFPDQVRELESVGVDVARNLYAEAGQGLADDACTVLDRRGRKPVPD